MMTGKVYKYLLGNSSPSTVVLPSGAKILSARVQKNEIYIWAVVDTDRPDESRRFAILPTGHPGVQDNMVFVDTVMTPDHSLVYHVFEIGPEPR